MVKGRAHPYRGGERVWVKVKHRRTLDVVCAAVIGTRTGPTWARLGGASVSTAPCR